MLRKVVLQGVTVVAIASVSAVAVPCVAFAGTGTDSGTGSGSGGCTDSGTTVNCGAGTGGQSGSVGGSGGTGSGSGGGTAPQQCPDWVLYSTEFGSEPGPPPAGAVVPGDWYVDLCAVGGSMGMGNGVNWFASGQVPGTPPPDPATVGAQAASELHFSNPALAFSPSATAYTNLAEWLWIDPSIWHVYTTSAQACTAGGCVTATATATPAYVTWNLGDGSTVTCNGPGLAWNSGLSPTAQSTSCSHTYVTTSAGQPSPDGNPNDAAFSITAQVTWTIAWTGPGGSAGVLPAITTKASASLKVAEIESVNT